MRSPCAAVSSTSFCCDSYRPFRALKTVPKSTGQWLVSFIRENYREGQRVPATLFIADLKGFHFHDWDRRKAVSIRWHLYHRRQ